MVPLAIKIIFSVLIPLSLAIIPFGMAGPLLLSGLFLLALVLCGCLGAHVWAAVFMVIGGVLAEVGEMLSGFFPMGGTKPNRWAMGGSFVGGLAGALAGGILFFPLGALPGTFLGTFSGGLAGALLKNPDDLRGAVEQSRALLLGRVAGTILKVIIGIVMMAVALWILWNC